MTDQEIDLINLSSPELISKIKNVDAEERFPGVYRLRLGFENGRGASIIGGPGVFWFPDTDTFEIGQLNSDGRLATAEDGRLPDLRRGTETEITEWALEIANQPPEGET